LLRTGTAVKQNSHREKAMTSCYDNFYNFCNLYVYAKDLDNGIRKSGKQRKNLSFAREHGTALYA
jgi:hypothetical protein